MHSTIAHIKNMVYQWSSHSDLSNSIKIQLYRINDIYHTFIKLSIHHTWKSWITLKKTHLFIAAYILFEEIKCLSSKLWFGRKVAGKVGGICLATMLISVSWVIGPGTDCSLGLANGTGIRSRLFLSSSAIVLIPGTHLHVEWTLPMEVKEFA